MNTHFLLFSFKTYQQKYQQKEKCLAFGRHRRADLMLDDNMLDDLMLCQERKAGTQVFSVPCSIERWLKTLMDRASHYFSWRFVPPFVPPACL